MSTFINPIILGALMGQAFKAPPAFSWLDGWENRKKITLSRPTGAVTDYQMMLTIVRDNGLSSGSTVYVADKCEEDYSDIRFTLADGTLLNYWIELSDSSSATIWVKFDSIADSETEFHMYYGNASATAYENGENTFEFFDHFEGTGLDLDKWTDFGATSVIEDSIWKGISVEGALDYIIASTSSFGVNHILRVKAKTKHFASEGFYEEIIGLYDLINPTYFSAFFNSSTVLINGKYVSINNTTEDVEKSSILGVTAETWFVLDLIHGEDCIGKINNGNVVTLSNFQSTSNVNIAIFAQGIGAEVYVDWVLIRKYIDTEPTWGDWQAEETK